MKPLLTPGTRGMLWMLGAALFFSMSVGFVKHLSHTLTSFEIVFLRQLIGLVFMVPWLMKVGLGALRTQHLGMHATRGVLSAANMWCLFGALSLAPVADVSAITFMMPIIASIFAVIFLKEATTLRQWLAALVAGGPYLLAGGLAWLGRPAE